MIIFASLKSRKSNISISDEIQKEQIKESEFWYGVDQYIFERQNNETEQK